MAVQDPAYFLNEAFKSINLSDPRDYPKSREAQVRSAVMVAKAAAEVEAITAKSNQRSNLSIRWASAEERNQLNHFLRGLPSERRDMGNAGGGAFPGSSGSFLAPISFERTVIEAQKLEDELVDPQLINWVKTERGSSHNMPLDNDVNAVAHVVSENAQDTSFSDPLMASLSLPACPTFRSGIFISRELFEDSGVDLPLWLAEIFGKRIGRAFGAQLAATLAANAPVTVTAAGAAASGQSSSISTSVGSDDLWHLASTLEPAYWLRSSWAMNFHNYTAIMSLRSTANGQPIFPPEQDADGNAMLMSRRVAICPSLPNTAVILGDLKRLICRQAGGLNLSVSAERRPEYNQLYARAMFRLQAAASICSDTPFVCLATAGTMQAGSGGSQPPAKAEGSHHGRTQRT